MYTQLDTGSSDFWVDPQCANAQDAAFCAQFPEYDPSKSSTVYDAGEELNNTYGIGAVIGEFLIDAVVIGSRKILLSSKCALVADVLQKMPTLRSNNLDSPRRAP